MRLSLLSTFFAHPLINYRSAEERSDRLSEIVVRRSSKMIVCITALPLLLLFLYALSIPNHYVYFQAIICIFFV